MVQRAALLPWPRPPPPPLPTLTLNFPSALLRQSCSNYHPTLPTPPITPHLLASSPPRQNSGEVRRCRGDSSRRLFTRLTLEV
ncbi:hypothetical protein E2C01_022817 [Portunus trituberculatus]|uniref:Uncharacterized protein n=1 Tax=Portunus trituberculatus TaxID=210409 RepID=A0A5B7E8N1_PORTR|nr:hypothetical protein [Portunus trituberculatus]